jgi:hypothetical protein
MISRRAWHLLSVPHVLPIRFADLRYFLSQFYDAVFDRILHDDKANRATERGGRKARFNH